MTIGNLSSFYKWLLKYYNYYQHVEKKNLTLIFLDWNGGADYSTQFLALKLGWRMKNGYYGNRRIPTKNISLLALHWNTRRNVERIMRTSFILTWPKSSSVFLALVIPLSREKAEHYRFFPTAILPLTT